MSLNADDWLNNQRFVDRATVPELCVWLVKGFHEGNFEPFTLVDEVSSGSQFRALHRLASAETQERLRGAVACAIGLWDPKTHSLAMLRGLAYLAADFRAASAVSSMRRLFDNRSLDWRDAGEGRETYGSLLAVIGGFAEEHDAFQFLHGLYFDVDVPSIYRPLLFSALCRHSPTDYPDYVHGLMGALDENGSGAFAVDLLFRRFIDVVGVPRIYGQAGQLSEPERCRFLDLYVTPSVQAYFRDLDTPTKDRLLEETTAYVARHATQVGEPVAARAGSEYSVTPAALLARVPGAMEYTARMASTRQGVQELVLSTPVPVLTADTPAWMEQA